jgi:DNA-binding transcriptional MerR regulator
MNLAEHHNNLALKAIEPYHNEAFDIGFYQYFKNINSNRISSILNDTDRKITFETISYRQLNSWGQQGLLNGNREGREWRRFSIIDALWVKIIYELRIFGMSWEQIKVAKESLGFESKKCGVAMPLLEFYTAFAIGSKMPVLLLIFKDGVTVTCSETQYKVAKEIVGIANHIQISLNEFLQRMFPEMDLKPSEKAELPIDVDEMELLAFLRMGKFEKVEIFYHGGKMRTVEGMERIDASALVGDVIREHQYQKIEIVVEGGKKVAIRRISKKQFNKKG